MSSYCPIMMRGNYCNYFQTQPYYPQYNINKALELIMGAVAGEREDELFYDYLISVAPTQKQKDIIAGIRDDERKHNKMFRQIYCELTGMVISSEQEEKFQKPQSYLEGIERALFGELDAVERYRQILFGLVNRHQINMLTEIITDELKHASKYNFIYAENTR